MQEEKDITKDFVRLVKDLVPEIADLLNKIHVVAQGNYVVVRVLGKDTMDALSKKEIPITQAISQIIPDPKIIFSAVDSNSPRAKMFKKERQSYTFSNFLVSDSNRSAFNAMKEVSQEPTGQPIVVFGPPSVGKTHLLKALRYKVRRDNKYSIILLDMGKIVNDVFFHIKNRTFDRYISELHSFNYLLIDDLQKAVQQVSGKALEKIDWLIFDLYEDFFEKDGKQLVFTIDRSPMMLPFSDRVRSRLFSGFAYPIDPPDEQIKRIYIERILEKYKPLDIPDKLRDVIVAKSINFRQMEELTKTAVEKYSATGDLDYVATQINILAKTTGKSLMHITADDVIDAVCQLRGLDKNELLSGRKIRNKRKLHALWIIAYILVKELGYTQKNAAKALNRKSPMSIYKYLKYVDALRIDDMDFRTEMDEIIADILHKK